MTYDALRAFADSWGLAFMCAFFIAAALFVLFRPKAGDYARNAAMIPFREDETDGR